MKLNKGAHIHLMGICGTAMASLAGLLQDKGYKVSGSDQNFYPPMSIQLEKLKINIMTGYKAENVQSKPDLVIVGNVISRDNPEVQEVMNLKLPYMSLPQAMSEFLIEDRQSVVIAGTHGKTTTTSLMAWTVEQAGLKPGFMVGGIPKNYGQSFKIPQGNWFVIEGDEYDTAFFDKVPKFIHYKPKYVVLTSIEFDHADIYKNLDEVKAAFIRLMGLIPQEGLLVYRYEDKNIASILSHCKAKKLSYGGNGADIEISEVAPTREGLDFTLSSQGATTKCFLPMFGEYNALNGAAVFALAQELKWNVDIPAAFKKFEGVKRRQEIIGRPRDIMIIEDFAHHPTAVGETISTFKKRPQSGKVHAVFEPRSATSRRNVFQEDYLKAFKNADYAYIAAPFAQEKIPVEQRFSSEKLVNDLNTSKTTEGVVCQNVGEIVTAIHKKAQPGDTILVMSNGGFDGIYEKLLKTLA